jgi:hypothetical protein
MQKRAWVLAVVSTFALWLVASAAGALPTGPIVSGNGQLEFSNFEFSSPGGKVDEDDITVNVLVDGISLSGPVDVDHGAVNFFVTYDVRALGHEIVTASLELDADPMGLVLSTKRILGDRGDDPFGAQLAFLKTQQVGGKGTFLEAARFAPQESIRVLEHVVVSAKEGASWNASINRFTVVPEPGTATLSLLGLGLLGLRSRPKR